MSAFCRDSALDHDDLGRIDLDHDVLISRDEASRRKTALFLIPLQELDRPDQHDARGELLAARVGQQIRIQGAIVERVRIGSTAGSRSQLTANSMSKRKSSSSMADRTPYLPPSTTTRRQSAPMLSKSLSRAHIFQSTCLWLKALAMFACGCFAMTLAMPPTSRLPEYAANPGQGHGRFRANLREGGKSGWHASCGCCKLTAS